VDFEMCRFLSGIGLCVLRFHIEGLDLDNQGSGPRPFGPGFLGILRIQGVYWRGDLGTLLSEGLDPVVRDPWVRGREKSFGILSL